MKNLLPFLGLFMLFAFTSCNTVRVTSDYDRSANFDQYKSFAFHQKGLADLKMNDLDKRRVVEAITQSLQSKGMSTAAYETAADIIINISANNKTRVNIEPWYDPWWGWGPMWGGSQRVNQYKEGTLILDFIDRRQNTLVWQGVGQGLNVSDIERKAEKIPVAVQEILAKYPPKK
ncbi:MAG: DUF4136 domain-containing protein [Flavobacteriaceae bacterium]|nr:DUF4136 domain-containing protein [Flavobacteriaceae bacterium]